LIQKPNRVILPGAEKVKEVLVPASAPFATTTTTQTQVEETDKTLASTVTKDTGLSVPSPAGTAVGASTAVSGITVSPTSGGGLIIAGSTAAGSPSREIDVTDPTTTTKVTTTTSTVTTTPATTNQFEHAAWNLAPGSSATILSLQMLGVSASYLALYRVTNDDGSNPVAIQMGQANTTLQPGTSIDVSAQQVAIASIGNLPARGSYQNLCCAAVSQALGQPKGGGAANGGTPAPAGGGGGGLIDLGGGGGDFPQLIFPDPGSSDAGGGAGIPLDASDFM
jgi:hypothetical protein